MDQYLELLRDTRDNGSVKTDRTGTGTVSVFGRQMRFNLQNGLPLITTKKLHLKAIVHELIWFLAGDTNIKYLNDNGVTIWDDWADANGNLGPVYGAQWRAAPGKVTLHRADTVHSSSTNIVATFGDADNSGVIAVQETIDQITEVMNLIKHNPDSRRIIVSSWSVADIPKMKLPPCHCLFQFYVNDLTFDERKDLLGKYLETNNVPSDVYPLTGHDVSDKVFNACNIPQKKLSCQLYQRSCDLFLGVPFNIASYALLTHMFAQQANMAVGDFIWTGGDCHIYSNHMEQVNLQLTRTPLYLPTLKLNKAASIFDYKYEDFQIVGYDYHPAIKAPIAV